MTYEPLDTLKQVDEDIWIVDGPIIHMAFPLGLRVPFPTRMTIVRLAQGGLWLHSPIAPTPALRRAVETLGPVEHLVSPNFIHYASIAGWAEAYPAAKTWASPGVRERAEAQGIAVHFADDLRDAPAAAWADELEQLVFEGSRVIREVVFFHVRSRTLILADLIENFEPERIPVLLRPLLRLAGPVHPDGKAPVDLRMSFWGGHERARRSLSRMLAWHPERVILAHGKWYEKDGEAELRRAFRWLT